MKNKLLNAEIELVMKSIRVTIEFLEQFQAESIIEKYNYIFTKLQNQVLENEGK